MDTLPKFNIAPEEKESSFPTINFQETNIAPENGWLEYYFPFGKTYFQGRAVKLQGCTKNGGPWETCHFLSKMDVIYGYLVVQFQGW